jgi:hypothetical protein
MKTKITKSILFIVCVSFFSNINSQDIIEYKLPKDVETIVSKEFKRDFYNLEKQFLFLRMGFDCDTTIVFLGALDKDVPDDKISPKQFIVNTNRYLVIDNLKIPVIFNSDFIYNKNPSAIKSTEYFIKFNRSGKILGSNIK